MKKGLLTALLIVSIIVIIILLIGGYIYYQVNREPFIPENSLLVIPVGGQIVNSEVSPLSKKITLKDIWFNILRAKIDPRIKKIQLNISELYTGFATVDDIGRMIREFKKSGKKVDAFIRSGGLRELQLGSYADKVYTFKRGGLLLNGLSIHAIFIKNTLSKLGIEADFFNIGEYKTGPNMFTKNSMNAPHKESYKSLLDDIYNSSIEIISKNRKIKPEVLKQLIEEFETNNKIYLKKKLIDGIVYEDSLTENSNLKKVFFSTYMATSSPKPYTGKNKIALIFADGEIHSGASGGKSMFGGKIMGSDTISSYLRSAAKDDHVKAVVFRVDSPGGSPFASDRIRHEAQLVMKKKPVVISMGSVAASGGYMISLSSSKICALPQTITGSIGVYGGKFVLKGLYEKAGIKKEVVKTSTYADMFSDYRKFSEAERIKYMSIMKNIYHFFIEETSKSRKMKTDEVDKVARGRVWSGVSAKKLMLVDEYNGLTGSIKLAAKLAGFKKGEKFGIRIFPSKKSLFDYIIDTVGSGTSISIENIKLRLKAYSNFFPAVILPVRFEVR